MHPGLRRGDSQRVGDITLQTQSSQKKSAESPAIVSGFYTF
jgi:hypothetical protein